MSFLDCFVGSFFPTSTPYLSSSVSCFPHLATSPCPAACSLPLSSPSSLSTTLILSVAHLPSSLISSLCSLQLSSPSYCPFILVSQSSIQHTFTEHLSYIRHCCTCWENICEQNSANLCPHRARVLVGADRKRSMIELCSISRGDSYCGEINEGRGRRGSCWDVKYSECRRPHGC